MKHTLVALVLLCLVSAPLVAQATLHTSFGDILGSSNNEYGSAVAGAGDVDGDGVPDLIVGASRHTIGFDIFNAGYVFVFSGATGELIHELAMGPAFGAFGTSVTGIGDLDDDGHNEIVAGAPGIGFAGQVAIYSGIDGSLFDIIDGPAGNFSFGTSVSNAGDVNNDGVPDLIVGDDDAGIARVVSGATRTILHTFTGSATDDYSWDVSGAGDVNSDGFGDVIVGSYQPFTAGGSGEAFVYSGRTGQVLHTFTGAVAGDWFGYSVSRAGDVDDDGFADVIVGAVKGSAIVAGAGSARVFSGDTGATLHTFSGVAVSDGFGFAVAGLGDVDGDLIPDVAVGAPEADDNGNRSGAVHVYSGATGANIITYPGRQSGQSVGISVGQIGDLNGDGRNEVITGSLYDYYNNVSTLGGARVFCFDCPVWQDLSGGTPGSGGIPQLYLSGTLEPSSIVTLELSHATSDALALLFVSFASTPTPFLGGTLHAFPFAELVPLGLGSGAQGALKGAAVFPGAPVGSQLFFQVGVVDASVPVWGASLSGAVVGTVP